MIIQIKQIERFFEFYGQKKQLRNSLKLSLPKTNLASCFLHSYSGRFDRLDKPVCGQALERVG